MAAGGVMTAYRRRRRKKIGISLCNNLGSLQRRLAVENTPSVSARRISRGINIIRQSSA